MKLMYTCILLLVCWSWRVAAEEDPPDELVNEASDSDFEQELSIPDAYNEQIFFDEHDEAPQLDNASRRKRDAERRRLINYALGGKKSGLSVGGRKRHLGPGARNYKRAFISGGSHNRRDFGRNRGLMSLSSSTNNKDDGTLATLHLPGSNPNGATDATNKITALPLNKDGLNWIKWLMQSGGAAQFGYKWSGKTPTDEDAMQFMATLFGGKGDPGKESENMIKILQLMQSKNQDSVKKGPEAESGVPYGLWPRPTYPDGNYPPGYPRDDIYGSYPPRYPSDDNDRSFPPRYPTDVNFNPAGNVPEIPYNPDFPEDYRDGSFPPRYPTDVKFNPAGNVPEIPEDYRFNPAGNVPEIPEDYRDNNFYPTVGEPATEEPITPDQATPAPDLDREPPAPRDEEDDRPYSWKPVRYSSGNSKTKGKGRGGKGTKGGKGGKRSYGKRGVALWHPDAQKRTGRRRSFFDIL